MLAGKGVVANGIYYLDPGDRTNGLPGSTVAGGVPGHPMSTGSTGSAKLTGVYTATATPSSEAASRIDVRPLSAMGLMAPLTAVAVSLGLGMLMIL